jgi:hypothetical protein
VCEANSDRDSEPGFFLLNVSHEFSLRKGPERHSVSFVPVFRKEIGKYRRERIAGASANRPAQRNQYLCTSTPWMI